MSKAGIRWRLALGAAGILVATGAVCSVPTTALAMTESEPNDSYETANVIHLGERCDGQHNGEEALFEDGQYPYGIGSGRDFYKLEMPAAGKALVSFCNDRFFIDGYNTPFTLKMSILDGDKEELDTISVSLTRTVPTTKLVSLAKGTNYIFIRQEWGHNAPDTDQPYHFRISLPFTDLPEETPHFEESMSVAHAGVAEGWAESDGTRTFRPYNTVTRADMAAFLFRMARNWDVDGADDDWSPTASQKAAFVDVDATTPHAREIWWLASEGISEGWKVGSSAEFRPYDPVVRQDMAAFLFRLAKVAGKGGADSENALAVLQNYGKQFVDVDGEWDGNHHEEVWWLASRGVTTGWDVAGGKKEFRGMSPILRCDMAAFIFRMDYIR